MKKTSSLRRRLLSGVLSAVALAWLAVAAAGYWAARHELNELLDAHLVQTAGILAAQISLDGGTAALEHAPQLHRYGRRVAFQVWEGETLGLHSVSAPATRLTAGDAGFADSEAEGRKWRVFSVRAPGSTRLLQVAEQIETREEVSHEIAEHLLMPLAVTLPLLGLALALVIGRALKPLNELARQVAERDATRLDPISAIPAPAEVVPLVEQLNGLFRGIERSLENERRFTADASHELRTPLSAIRAQAQVARGAADAGERRAALDRLLQACDRAGQTIEQLLTLARLDAGAGRAAGSRCDVVSAAREVLASLGAWSHRRGVSLELIDAARAELEADPALVHILIRNLVDNAVRYSPRDERVTVRIAADSSEIRFQVEDRGPGIPVAERHQVLHRFYRLEALEPGAGLGLSIVARIAELYGARLELADTSERRGLRVTVSFPAESTATSEPTQG